MNDSPRPQKLLAEALPTLVVAAVPLAAFLAFSIQPLLGKRLVPIYGGTSGTWLGCMVYFQLALLLGYGWAAWLVRKPAGFQAGATALLGLLAVVTFRLPDDHAYAAASIARVVWRLSFTTLPAMVLLFSTAPLLHGWLRRRGEEIPYYLYAVSSAGSLAAVVIYPFFVEPSLRLGEQTFYWHGCLTVVAGLLAAAGYLFRQSSNAAGARSQPEAEVREPVAFGTGVLWLWLSALTCVGMLGATYHLTAEIGSNPLAWVGPFGLYLLSFTVVFSGRWRRWMTLTTLVWLAVSLSGFMVAKGFTAATVNAATAWWLLSLTASGSFLGNALLYQLRPAKRFETFYLVLAAGGVLGGLVSGMIIPVLLSQPIEFELASVALLTTGMLWFAGRRDPAFVAVTTCVLLVPVLILGLHQRRGEALGQSKLVHLRDLYGHLMIKTDARSVVLSSDTTLHGTQLTSDAAARHRPTRYYTESTGVGRTLEKLQAGRPRMNVGVIGLGAGTLAAYARTDDTYDFWDVDPKALRVARENFSFVAESAGHVNLAEADGRKALEDSKTDYDLLVVDAFTGGGVPSHLLTHEALALYLRRLAARDGLLVVHTPSRYFRFFPVVEATARTLGHSAINVTTDISDATADRDWDPTHTEYVIVCRAEQLKAISDWFPAEEDKGRVKHQLDIIQAPLINAQLLWSDERNAAIDTINVGQFLFGP